jgi:hypothetical protein
MGRNYRHTSEHCKFLDSVLVGTRRYDLYLHEEHGSEPRLVARYGNAEGEVIDWPVAGARFYRSRDDGALPEPIVLALQRLEQTPETEEVTLGFEQEDAPEGADVTPEPSPIQDLAEWSDLVRASEAAAVLFADATLVMDEEQRTCALVCKTQTKAKEIYGRIEAAAGELHLLPEPPKAVVYLHWKGGNSTHD